MVTTKQRNTARASTKKAQPVGRKRAEPGTRGEGEYYRIVVRPKSKFVTFRNQDVGEPGGLQRLAGQRASGTWSTQAWLISKEDAHISKEQLIPDSKEAKKLFATLGSKPVHKKGDVFTAKDRPNAPERKKPTEAQRRAWAANIKKAQAARRKS